jgi:hypothetical protein
MARTVLPDEGSFTKADKDAANSNFVELYADQTPPVAVTASTYTVTAADSGSIINLNRAAGIAVTLPAASGTGNVFRFYIGTSITSNTTTIKVANSSDVMGGVATIGSSGGTSLSTGTTTTSDTITFNGSTQGGLIGSYVEVRDVQTNLFQVQVHGVGSGVAITPFSATV